MIYMAYNDTHTTNKGILMQRIDPLLADVAGRIIGLGALVIAGAIVTKVQTIKHNKEENIIVLKKKHFSVAK